MVFGKTHPGFFVLLCHPAHLITPNVCLSAFSWLPESHTASSGQCSAVLARLPSGLVGPCGRSSGWLLESRSTPGWEVLTPVALREAGCGQTELARCLQDCGATFSQNRASAKLLIVALFSCLLPSQVRNGNESLCRAPCFPVALGGL